MGSIRILILKIALVVLGAILFLSMTTRNDSPRVTPGHTFESQLHPPTAVVSTLRKSCYDCHSNETEWPWYSHVPPVSWLVHGDVTAGRRAMNFSEWSTTAGSTTARSQGFLTAVCIAMKSDMMPKKEYLRLHPGARLTDAEKKSFCDWEKAVVSRNR